MCIPERKPRGRKPAQVFREEHVRYIITLVDSFSSYALAQMLEMVRAKFPEIQVSKSKFHDCSLSIKKLERVVAYRTLEETLIDRKNTVMEWLADLKMDFKKSCVFLDEAGFNIHISRTKGWLKGNPSKTTMPKSKSSNVTIIGAICAFGVLSLALRKSPTVSKKRDVNGRPVKITGRMCLRTLCLFPPKPLDHKP
jgi:hypothetical protein